MSVETAGSTIANAAVFFIQNPNYHQKYRNPCYSVSLLETGMSTRWVLILEIISTPLPSPAARGLGFLLRNRTIADRCRGGSRLQRCYGHCPVEQLGFPVLPRQDAPLHHVSVYKLIQAPSLDLGGPRSARGTFHWRIISTAFATSRRSSA